MNLKVLFLTVQFHGQVGKNMSHYNETQRSEHENLPPLHPASITNNMVGAKLHHSTWG